MSRTSTDTAISHHDFQRRLDEDGRHPALSAETAIRNAIEAARGGEAEQVRQEVEYAKYAIISRRCGMDVHMHGRDLATVMTMPGLELCSGLSNVSDMAQQGVLEPVVPILAEAAMRAHALAA